MKNKEQIAREYGILSRKDADFDSAILNAMEEYYQQSYANGDYCSVKPPPIVFDEKIDSIKIAINKDSLIIDSLMKLRPKVVIKYKTKFDTIYKQAPDTCKSYLAKLNAECLKMDSFNLGIITRQETQLISYSELTGIMQEKENMYVLRHNEDSLLITKLDKKLKRTRKVGIAAFGVGLIGGLFIK
jgi:hypothetical protein